MNDLEKMIRLAGMETGQNETIKTLKRVALEEKALDKVEEAKNHLGETEYNSFDAWKRAAKKKNSQVWFDGDRDIAQAMVGPKPYKKGETTSIGEWDGAVGVIYNDQVKEEAIQEALMPLEGSIKGKNVLKTIGLDRLNDKQIDEAFQNAGYTDNDVNEAKFVGVNKSGDYHYTFYFDDGGKKAKGNAYVYIDRKDGMIKAEN